jgi:hypothetical protein
MGEEGLRRLLAALGAAAALLAACTSTPAGPPDEDTPLAPAVIAVPPPQQSERPRGDTCGAADFQYLVGRPRTEIPVPVDPTRRRVACTTCPVTQDLRSDRLNIFYDEATGIVREVRCG